MNYMRELNILILIILFLVYILLTRREYIMLYILLTGKSPRGGGAHLALYATLKSASKGIRSKASRLVKIRFITLPLKAFT